MIPEGQEGQDPRVGSTVSTRYYAGGQQQHQQQQSPADLPAYGIVEELTAPYARHRTFVAPVLQASAPSPRPDQNPMHLFTNTFYQQNPPAPAASDAAAPPRSPQQTPPYPTGLQRPQEAFTGSSTHESEPDYGLVAELRGQNAAATLVPGFGMAAEVTRMRQAQMLLPQSGAAQGRPRGERVRLAPTSFQVEGEQGNRIHSFALKELA